MRGWAACVLRRGRPPGPAPHYLHWTPSLPIPSLGWALQAGPRAPQQQHLHWLLASQKGLSSSSQLFKSLKIIWQGQPVNAPAWLKAAVSHTEVSLSQFGAFPGPLSKGGLQCGDGALPCGGRFLASVLGNTSAWDRTWDGNRIYYSGLCSGSFI